MFAEFVSRFLCDRAEDSALDQGNRNRWLTGVGIILKPNIDDGTFPTPRSFCPVVILELGNTE
jgi:hypothetical protein